MNGKWKAYSLNDPRVPEESRKSVEATNKEAAKQGYQYWIDNTAICIVTNRATGVIEWQQGFSTLHRAKRFARAMNNR